MPIIIDKDLQKIKRILDSLKLRSKDLNFKDFEELVETKFIDYLKNKAKLEIRAILELAEIMKNKYGLNWGDGNPNFSDLPIIQVQRDIERFERYLKLLIEIKNFTNDYKTFFSSYSKSFSKLLNKSKYINDENLKLVFENKVYKVTSIHTKLFSVFYPKMIKVIEDATKVHKLLETKLESFIFLVGEWQKCEDQIFLEKNKLTDKKVIFKKTKMLEESLLAQISPCRHREHFKNLVKYRKLRNLFFYQKLSYNVNQTFISIYISIAEKNQQLSGKFLSAKQSHIFKPHL